MLGRSGCHQINAGKGDGERESLGNGGSSVCSVQTPKLPEPFKKHLVMGFLSCLERRGLTSHSCLKCRHSSPLATNLHKNRTNPAALKFLILHKKKKKKRHFKQVEKQLRNAGCLQTGPAQLEKHVMRGGSHGAAWAALALAPEEVPALPVPTLEKRKIK